MTEFFYLPTILPFQVPGVDCFTYLGNVMSKDEDCSIGSKKRLGNAWGAFQRLKKIWMSKDIDTNKKIRIFQQHGCTRTSISIALKRGKNNRD